MASVNISRQLSQLENANNPQQRSEGYNTLLSNILTSHTDLPASLVAYVRSILSDSIGVIHSRPLLSAFVEQYRTLSNNDAKLESGTTIVELLAPRIVSYEQQDTDIKFILADAYETDEDFGNSAKTCLLYTSPSPRDRTRSRMPSSA